MKVFRLTSLVALSCFMFDLVLRVIHYTTGQPNSLYFLFIYGSILAFAVILEFHKTRGNKTISYNQMDQYYATLGIGNNASLKEVKQAHRNLIKLWHPDKFPNNYKLQKKATEKAAEMNIAYNKIIKYLMESSAHSGSFQSESASPSASSSASSKQRPAGKSPAQRNTEGVGNLL